jgi:hypothetical protein
MWRRYSKDFLNSMSTLVLVPLFAAPAFLGVLVWDHPIKALVGLLSFALLFILSYWVAVDLLATRGVGLRSRRDRFQDVPARTSPNLSPLSGMFIEDSMAVDVRIARVSGSNSWSLLTESANATGRKWSQNFASDLDAWMFFLKIVETDGMLAVVGDEIRKEDPDGWR